MYLAIKRGVYRHDILGAFDDIDEAKACGHEFVTNEHDHYHTVEIVRVEVGRPEDLLGEICADYAQAPKPYTFVGTRWTGVSDAP